MNQQQQSTNYSCMYIVLHSFWCETSGYHDLNGTRQRELPVNHVLGTRQRELPDIHVLCQQ